MSREAATDMDKHITSKTHVKEQETNVLWIFYYIQNYNNLQYTYQHAAMAWAWVDTAGAGRSRVQGFQIKTVGVETTEKNKPWKIKTDIYQSKKAFKLKALKLFN